MQAARRRHEIIGMLGQGNAIEIRDFVGQRKGARQTARFLNGSIGNIDTVETLADALFEECSFGSTGAAGERLSGFEGQVALAQYSPEPKSPRWMQPIRGSAVFVEKDLLLGARKRLAPDLALLLARLAIGVRPLTKLTNDR